MTFSHTSPPGHVPSKQSPIEYPSNFPIKVVGPMRDDFAMAVVEVVRLHDPEFHERRLGKRLSFSGNYLGLMVIMRMTSCEQLDTLYQALTSHPMVGIVLRRTSVALSRT